MRLNSVYLLGRSIVSPPEYVDCAPALRPAPPAVHEIFARPLIIGASVSANLKTRGPADRVLGQLGLDSIKPERVAANGQTARELIDKLKERHFTNASVVLGIDMFFWDATLPSLKRSLEALERLSQLAQRGQAPVVLATIPSVTWWPLQYVRQELNLEIRALSAGNPQFLLLDIEVIIHAMQRAGGFRLNEAWYDLSQIAPDGLHVSSFASEYLAQRLLELFI